MKSNLDTVVLFRWDSQSQEIIHIEAEKRCLSDSALIRRLLGSWIVALKSKEKLTQTNKLAAQCDRRK